MQTLPSDYGPVCCSQIREALGQQNLMHKMEMKYRRMDIAKERADEEHHKKVVLNSQLELPKKKYLKVSRRNLCDVPLRR